MYGLHPTSMVLAIESTRRPEIPKSQSLNCPFLLTNTLEGLTSDEVWSGGRKGGGRGEGEEGGEGERGRREGERGRKEGERESGGRREREGGREGERMRKEGGRERRERE